MAQETTAPTRAEMVQELGEIYVKLYENEPADLYDIPGARQWWASLTMPMLEHELECGREKLKRLRQM